MISQEEREKIAKLPTWVRNLIKRLEYGIAPMVDELARNHKARYESVDKAKRLEETNLALMELIRKAGQAGLNWAKTTVDVLEGYEIFRDGDKHGD